MRSPNVWKLPLDKRFGFLVLVTIAGCAYPTDEFADGGSGGSVSSTGGKNSSDGGSVNPGTGGASTGGRSSGGASTGGQVSGGAPSSGGALGSGGSTSTGGRSSGGASGSGGGASGGASAGGAAGVGGTFASGGASSSGGAPGAGGGTTDPTCTCDLGWVSATSIPAQDTGDCMGYMGMLYRYEPENADSHMTYCDPNCPPPTSGSDNCKWHAKMVLEGSCP